MAIPPLVLKIIADSSGVKKGVAETEAQVSGMKSSITQNATLMKTALIGGVVAGLAASAKAASDLGESQNKANVVFGRSVDVVNNFAAAAAESAGLSKQAALEGSASFGAMFDSAGLAQDAAAGMSTKMAQLAGDMASFNNQDPSEMLDRLRSGLAGEAEPLRRFGVFISEARVQTEAYRLGIAQMGAELTDAQKIQARYAIILQDTAKQQGDFARTLGSSLPNQIRAAKAEFTNLAAEVGKVLLPALLGLLKAVREIPAPIIVAAGALTTLAAATVAVSTAVQALEGTWLAKLLARFGPLGLAVTTGAVAWDQYSKAMEGARADMEAADVQINAGRGGLVLLKNQTNATGQSFDGMATSIGTVNSNLKDLAPPLERTADRVQKLTEEEKKWAGETATSFGDFVTGTTKLKDAWSLTTEEFVHNMKVQVQVAREGFKDIRELGNEAIPTEFKQWLVDQGPAAVHAFVEGSKQQQERIIAAWKRATGFVNDYSNAINQIPKDVYTTTHLTVESNPIVGGKHFPERQHGGPVLAGRAYTVGEAGPETFVPRTSGTIIPAGGGGGDVILQVDGEVLARILRDKLVRLGRRNVTAGIV